MHIYMIGTCAIVWHSELVNADVLIRPPYWKNILPLGFVREISCSLKNL